MRQKSKIEAMEFLIPKLNSVVITVIITLLLYALYNSISRGSKVVKRPQPPKAGGEWPIIGHLPVLSGPQLPYVTLGTLADKYGPIFTISLGLHQALVVSSWEIAKELFTINDIAVSSRPKLTANKHLAYDSVMFGFAPYGTYWREMRKIVTLELLSARRIELMSHVRISVLETSLKELHEVWSKQKNGLGHALVNLQEWFGNLNSNVIFKMVVGKRFIGNVEDETKAQRCRKVFREFFRLMGVFVVRDAIPFLGWLDVGGHEKAMKRIGKEIDDIAEEWLQEHLSKRDGPKNQEATSEQDFMDVMISLFHGINQHGFDSDTIIKSACVSLILGGADTTTGTLTWAISLLLNNLHVLRKAQEELDKCIGRNRQVTESDLGKLIYLHAIVKETLRLQPVAPLSGPREFTQDCTVGGYHVKKGTRLITNIWKIHRDHQIWPNPLEFEPERFLTTHKDVDLRGKHFELIPFGSGRRACPGTAFGLQMVHVTLARFLQAFEISRPSNAPIDMTASPGMTNVKTFPLEVCVSPRLPQEHYY